MGTLYRASDEQVRHGFLVSDTFKSAVDATSKGRFVAS